MYYIIETEYVGPNAHENAGRHWIAIATEPAVNNGNGEPCVNGWCGTTNDYCVTAHGAYETLEEAEAALDKTFPEKRDWNGYTDFDDVVRYGYGKFEPMNFSEAEDWLYEAMRTDITTETTDDEIDALAIGYEDIANSENYTIEDWAVTILRKYRDNL